MCEPFRSMYGRRPEAIVIVVSHDVITQRDDVHHKNVYTPAVDAFQEPKSDDQ